MPGQGEEESTYEPCNDEEREPTFPTIVVNDVTHTSSGDTGSKGSHGADESTGYACSTLGSKVCGCKPGEDLGAINKESGKDEGHGVEERISCGNQPFDIESRCRYKEEECSNRATPPLKNTV